MKPLIKQIVLFDGSYMDPRAIAFLNATGLTTDFIIAPAINNFVIDINSIWNKLYAVYPLVGGTASTHKFNLINPLDTNAAFRLTFAGGLTHNSNGITGSGVNGTITTYFDCSVNGTLNSLSLSAYSKTAGNNGGAEFAVNTASTRTNLLIQYTTGTTYFDINNTYLGTAVSLATTATGLYVSSRTASNVINLYRRGVNVSSKANVTTTAQTGNLAMMILSGGGYSSRNIAFYHIGQGLTAGEVTTLNNAVQRLQTALGRQAY